NALGLGYPIDELLDAVRGWKNSPHHRGENQAGTTYHDLELLLRDAEQLERFRDFARGGAPKAPTTANPADLAVAASYAAIERSDAERRAHDAALATAERADPERVREIIAAARAGRPLAEAPTVQ